MLNDRTEHQFQRLRIALLTKLLHEYKKKPFLINAEPKRIFGRMGFLSQSEQFGNDRTIPLHKNSWFESRGIRRRNWKLNLHNPLVFRRRR